MSLSVRQTVKVMFRGVGGGGECGEGEAQTGDVQKARYHYVAEEMTVKHITRRQLQGCFAVRRDSRQEGRKFLVRFNPKNDVTTSYTSNLEKKYVTQQEMRWDKP
jgi:hypothetical protein